MSAGDKRVLYRNHCVPQEQVGSGNRYYLDSDCGRKLTGENLYSLDTNTTATATITSTTLLSSGYDFIAITATSISSGTVTISLDGKWGTTSGNNIRYCNSRLYDRNIIWQFLMTDE